MNRIDRTFQELKAKKKKAFIAFITAGYPSLKKTEELVLALERAGADAVELGVPFSDPLADGKTIQEASVEALKNGVTLERILESVERLRRKTDIPIALMTYYNPVFRFGEKAFTAKAKASGVDGLIIPDLPVEEAGGLIREARAKDLSTVFFIAPTTRPGRMKKIIQAVTGFVYYVSLTGVTGERVNLPKEIAKHIQDIKKKTAKPVCVGFGISTPKQVKDIASSADGVIVGSAIINVIRKYASQKNMPGLVEKFVKSLTRIL